MRLGPGSSRNSTPSIVAFLSALLAEEAGGLPGADRTPAVARAQRARPYRGYSVVRDCLRELRPSAAGAVVAEVGRRWDICRSLI